MATADWFRPPRSVLTLYLAGAATAMACLVWLAISQLSSDELAEAQRNQQRLAAAADRVAVRVQQGLNDLDRALSEGFPGLPDGAVVVRRAGESIVIERGMLPFVPVAPASAEIPHELFVIAESAELVDPRRAAVAYRELAAAGSRAVRARALIGLGRTLRKAGRHADAIEVYENLAAFPDIVIEARPVDLIARIGICRALQESGQQTRLATEAAALRTDLSQGKWAVTGAVWKAVFDDVSAGAGADPLAGGELRRQVAAAAALETVWQDLRDGMVVRPRLVASDAGTGLVAWKRDESVVRALVVEADWLEGLWRQTAIDAGVDVALLDREEQPILGHATAGAVSLAASETGLPWTIAVADSNPEQGHLEAAARRRTFLMGLGVVGLLIVASGYFTFRGIRRELAIARMHADFVSAASHEFRTPLTSIRQLSHMLQDGRVHGDDRRGQYYGVLVRESERLHRLVERLLSFGRADAGRIHPESLDARDLAAAVAADFRQRVDDRAIDVVTPDTPCRVRADREMLSLALWNLLDNAAKYSPVGSPVRLDVHAGTDRIGLAVRDQGIGIRLEDRRRIFEQFVRGSDSASSGAPGSGLGLALVERVVRAHGGEVHIESEVGQGSVFTISLPREMAA